MASLTFTVNFSHKSFITALGISFPFISSHIWGGKKKNNTYHTQITYSSVTSVFNTKKKSLLREYHANQISWQQKCPNKRQPVYHSVMSYHVSPIRIKDYADYGLPNFLHEVQHICELKTLQTKSLCSFPFFCKLLVSRGSKIANLSKSILCIKIMQELPFWPNESCFHLGLTWQKCQWE